MEQTIQYGQPPESPAEPRLKNGFEYLQQLLFAVRMDLFEAAYYGKLLRVKQLLEEGADVNKKNKYGWSPLYIASQQGNTEVVVALLEAGANVNLNHNNKCTALSSAIQNCRRDVVKVLLDAGADPNIKDGQGWTPLRYTMLFGLDSLTRVLLEAGAEPKLSDFRELRVQVLQPLGLMSYSTTPDDKTMETSVRAITSLRTLWSWKKRASLVSLRNHLLNVDD